MNLVPFPVLLALLGAAVLMLLRRPRVRFVVALIIAAATLPVSGVIASIVFDGQVLVTTLADWPAPYGISLVVDGLSATMLLLSGIAGLLTVLFVDATLQAGPRRGYGSLLNRARELFGAQALFQLLLLGVHLPFLTGDVFNLFLQFHSIDAECR